MMMDLDRNRWRRALAVAVLPFAVLGAAGCDNTGTGDAEEVEQEAPDTGESGGSTAGELPYEDSTAS